MKKKKVFGLVALLTVFALNVQWFGLAQDLYLFNVSEALAMQSKAALDGGGGGFTVREYNDTVTIVSETPDTATTATAPSNIASAYVIPVSSERTLLNCPWQCGAEASKYYVIPVMCVEAGEMMAELDAQINSTDGGGLFGGSNDTVYDVTQTYGTWVWTKYNVTAGIGWSGWWVSFANYCTGLGLWESSNASSISFAQYTELTFTISDSVTVGTYGVNLLAKDTTAGVLRMQGTFAAGGTGGTVKSPTFNSPFIYFSNVSDGAYSLSLDSEWDRYQSVAPAFTQAARWDVEVEEGDMTVNGAQHDHLFYELAMHRIDLSRNGVNFSTKDELVGFLQNSTFFEKLHMTEVEKQNSLSYLLPRLEEASNYYLTILDAAAVEALSQLTVEPAPEQLVRTYYAVYPTVAPVKATDGLRFPAEFDSTKPTVKEYGEIIVKPEMYVFWK